MKRENITRASTTFIFFNIEKWISKIDIISVAASVSYDIIV